MPLGRKTCRQWIEIFKIWYCLWIFTTRCYGIAVYAIALCLSIRSQNSIKMAELRITQMMPHHRPETSFLIPKIMLKYEWDLPQRRCQIRTRMKNLWFATNSSLYLENGTRYTYGGSDVVSSYYIYSSCFPQFCGASFVKCVLFWYHFLRKVMIVWYGHFLKDDMQRFFGC